MNLLWRPHRGIPRNSLRRQMNRIPTIDCYGDHTDLPKEAMATPGGSVLKFQRRGASRLSYAFIISHSSNKYYVTNDAGIKIEISIVSIFWIQHIEWADSAPASHGPLPCYLLNSKCDQIPEGNYIASSWFWFSCWTSVVPLAAVFVCTMPF